MYRGGLVKSKKEDKVASIYYKLDSYQHHIETYKYIKNSLRDMLNNTFIRIFILLILWTSPMSVKPLVDKIVYIPLLTYAYFYFSFLMMFGVYFTFFIDKYNNIHFSVKYIDDSIILNLPEEGVLNVFNLLMCLKKHKMNYGITRYALLSFPFLPMFEFALPRKGIYVGIYYLKDINKRFILFYPMENIDSNTIMKVYECVVNNFLISTSQNKIQSYHVKQDFYFSLYKRLTMVIAILFCISTFFFVLLSYIFGGYILIIGLVPFPAILFFILISYIKTKLWKYRVHFIIFSRGAIMICTTERINILTASSVLKVKKLNTHLPYMEIIYKVGLPPIVTKRKFMLDEKSIEKVLKWWKENKNVDPETQQTYSNRFRSIMYPHVSRGR